MGKGINLLLKKYSNGIDKKIFPMPFIYKNKVFVCFFFKNKKETDSFTAMYLYDTSVKELIKFFTQKSIGQGYNKYYKHENKRTSEFINKIEGEWTLNDILTLFNKFKVDTILQWYFAMAKNHYNTEIPTKGITNNERTSFLTLKYEKEQEELAEKIKKQEEEFMILGGDY